MDKYNYSKLRGRIVEKYGSISNFCSKENLDKAQSGVYTYLKKGKPLPGQLICKMTSLLEIEVKDIGEYFFTLDVSKGLTK